MRLLIEFNWDYVERRPKIAILLCDRESLDGQLDDGIVVSQIGTRSYVVY